MTWKRFEIEITVLLLQMQLPATGTTQAQLQSLGVDENAAGLLVALDLLGPRAGWLLGPRPEWVSFSSEQRAAMTAQAGCRSISDLASYLLGCIQYLCRGLNAPIRRHFRPIDWDMELFRDEPGDQAFERKDDGLSFPDWYIQFHMDAREFSARLHDAVKPIMDVHTGPFDLYRSLRAAGIKIRDHQPADLSAHPTALAEWRAGLPERDAANDRTRFSLEFGLPLVRLLLRVINQLREVHLLEESRNEAALIAQTASAGAAPGRRSDQPTVNWAHRIRVAAAALNTREQALCDWIDELSTRGPRALAFKAAHFDTDAHVSCIQSSRTRPLMRWPESMYGPVKDWEPETVERCRRTLNAIDPALNRRERMGRKLMEVTTDMKARDAFVHDLIGDVDVLAQLPRAWTRAPGPTPARQAVKAAIKAVKHCLKVKNTANESVLTMQRRQPLLMRQLHQAQHTASAPKTCTITSPAAENGVSSAATDSSIPAASGVSSSGTNGGVSSSGTTDSGVPTSATSDDQQPERCTVCLDPVSQPALLQCLHIICSPCFKRLLHHSTGEATKCPSCRHVIVADELASWQPKLSGPHVHHTGEAIPYPDPAIVGQGTYGSKIEMLLYALREILVKGEKALIFSQWDDVLAHIRTSVQ